MRTFAVIFALAVVGSPVGFVDAQPASFWLRRWADTQTEPAASVSRVHLTESARYELEGAFGPREMGITSQLVIDVHRGFPARTIQSASVGDRQFDPHRRRRRRRVDHPIREDMLRSGDALLNPLAILRTMRLTGEVEEVQIDGREFVRVALVHREQDRPAERLSMWFERSSSRLVRTRAAIRAPDRGSMIIDVRYDRIEGLDLPVMRTMNGSFAARRRTRSFTIEVSGISKYRNIRIDGL